MSLVDLAALDAIIARLEKADALVERYTDLIVAEMRHLVPVKTGALRNSISAQLDGLVAEIVAGETLPDPRAVVQEYGSARIPAHPYLRPAIERYAAAFLAEIQALLD